MTQKQFPRLQPAGGGPAPGGEFGRFRRLEIALSPAWRRAVFMLAVAGAAMLLSGGAFHSALIAMLGESADDGPVRRALQLDPANPSLHHRLGMILGSTLPAAARAEGVRHLIRATELNPLNARYWSDLAGACEMAEDTACAVHAAGEAIRRSPMTPQVHWAGANTFLRAGRTDAALAEFRRLLELAPSYAPATFHLCLGTLSDPQLLREQVLPAGKDPQLHLALANFLTGQELTDAARQVWAETVATGARFPLAWATPYVEYWLRAGRGEEAAGAWHDLERLGIIAKPVADQQDNQIFNGDFEQAPLNAGLDWRYRPSPYLALDFSAEGAHTGRHCLRTDFNARQNEESAPVSQWVPVAPSHAYQLTAYVRSLDITSDSGPRLQVTDAVHPEALKNWSESTVGTTPWHAIGIEFCTGPGTSLVQVSVIRLRGRTFPPEITGSFWLDTVVLKSVGPADASACEGFKNQDRLPVRELK